MALANKTARIAWALLSRKEEYAIALGARPEAGILIVCEAGGRMNEVPSPLMLARGGPLLASAPVLFDRLVGVTPARLDLTQAGETPRGDEGSPEC